MLTFLTGAFRAVASNPTRACPLALALLGLGGCAEPPSDNDSSSTDTGSTTADESGSTAPATTASSTSSEGSSSSDDGSGSTTGAGLEDPCLAFPADACPADCTPMTIYSPSAQGCGVDVRSGVVMCVSSGEPLDPDEPTTFYAEVDGQVQYLVAHQPCTTSPVASPVGWTECTTGPDAPEACACLCGADGCPGAAEPELPQACGLDEPCGPTQLVVAEDSYEATEHDLCVLAALRDRMPGAYGMHVRLTSAFVETEAHVFLDGSEQAQVVSRNIGLDICWSAVVPWQPTYERTLQTPEWFDACINDPSLWSECQSSESWFVDYVEQPASCP
jgi:hypothetical protein